MEITDRQVQAFRTELYAHYAERGRHELPWRQTNDPYRIMVSELMLQQTQVARVIPKYHDFLEQFPDVETLAAAALGDVLRAWQGLGYNRRAKYLWQACQQVVREYGGKVPADMAGLVSLPGIGANTAGAILAYAFNEPAVFIETNIRTVYFHHYFRDRRDIADKELRPLLEATLDRKNPREFYWALMDYGSWLKAEGRGAVSRSKHYVRQSTFAGSRRQLRGQILRNLSTRSHTEAELQEMLQDERGAGVLDDLLKEGMIVREDGRVRLA